MKFYFYFPENLDLDELISNNYPKIKSFNRDKARYLLHLISWVRLSRKDYVTEEYTKLSSEIMQHMVDNYAKYWKYFIDDLKIVESNYSYQNNKNCLGYKFVDKYNTPIVKSEIELKDQFLRKKLKIFINRIKAENKESSFLTKWFNNKLEIDTEFCNKVIEEVYQLKLEYPHLRDVDFIKNRTKDPLKQRDFASGSIGRFNDGLIVPRRDKNVFRFHTVLTNMTSIYRNAVTYNGQKLCALDLTNSQVFLSTKLLSTNYLIKSSENGNKVELFSITLLNSLIASLNNL